MTTLEPPAIPDLDAWLVYADWLCDQDRTEEERRARAIARGIEATGGKLWLKYSWRPDVAAAFWDTLERIGRGMLTEQQKQLVADNLRLIHWFLNSKKGIRFRPETDDREELECAMALGLCEAARDFDSSRGVEFSTYAYRKLWSAYTIYWKKRERFEIEKQTVRDTPTKITSHPADAIIQEELLQRCRQLLPERYWKALEAFYIRELDVNETAREIKASRKMTYFILDKIRKKLRQNLPESYLPQEGP